MALPDQASAEREFLPQTAWWKFRPRFNVGGGQFIPAVRLHQKQSEGVMMQWGFIPAWAEGKLDTEPPRCIAGGTMDGSPLHRDAWLNGQRCIVPIAGFYVWELTAAGYRQPYFVRMIDRPVFGIAGIWDRSEFERDDVIESCSLVTVPSNDLLQRIGGADSAMPALLRREDYDLWLRATPVDAKAALRACDSTWLRAFPVSPRVNSLKYDDQGLIRPLKLRALAEA